MTVPIEERLEGIVEVLQMRLAETRAALAQLRKHVPLTEAAHVHKMARNAELVALRDGLIVSLDTFATTALEAEAYGKDPPS